MPVSADAASEIAEPHPVEKRKASFLLLNNGVFAMHNPGQQRDFGSLPRPQTNEID